MRVLYVATDLRDADILQQEVKRAAPKLTFDVCAGFAEARGRLDKTLVYDVMLVDSSMPEADQLQLIQYLRGKQIPLPVVILAGQGVSPSSTVVSAADECISRGPRLAERLAPGLRMAIERYRVVSTTTRENERLKRSEGRLRLIIEALPAGVVLVDHAGRILAMNLAGAALVGVAGPSDVVGRELYSLADARGAQALRDLVARALAGERTKVEFTCHGPDGENRHLVFDGLCIQREDAGQGSVLGVLAAATVAPAAGSGTGDDQPVEFAFGGDPAASADERLALDQTIEELRAEAARFQSEAEAERGRLQQALAELERARATAAEHHAHGTEIDQRRQEAESRLAEVDARYQEADAAIQSLTERLDQLTGELTTLQDERQRIAREADGLREELLEQRRLRLELEQTVAGLDADRKRLQALTASQSAVGARVAELEAELLTVRASIEARETELSATLDAERSATAAHVAELNAQLHALQSAAEAAAVAETAIAAELDRQRTEATRVSTQLENETQARQRAVAETQQVRDELEAAIAARSGERGEIELRMGELQAALDAAREDAAQLSAERDREAAERKRVGQVLDERLEEMAVLATQGEVREALEARVAEFERQLADAQRDHTALTRDRAELTLARAALEERLAEADHRIEQGQAALGALVARASDLEGRLTSTQRQVEDRRSRLEALETQTAELEARRQAAVARIAELEESRRNEQGALADSVRREADLQEEMRLSREEYARVTRERDAARADLTHDHETRRALEDERSARKAEAERLRADRDAQIASRQAEIDRLVQERDAGSQAFADAQAAVERAEAVVRGLRAEIQSRAQREEVLATELGSLRDERDARGRQAFDLENQITRERAETARERAERAELTARLEVTEREAADARRRAEVSAVQVQRDHEEVVARLQKLLEQSAAREFQAAAAASTRPAVSDRSRRRPADRIGQLASAMANDLHLLVNEMVEEARRLLAELPEGSTVRGKAEHSLQSANRASQLVRHLLRLSEREARATSGVETSGIVRANELMLRQLAGPDIDLRLELGAGLPPVECDTEDVVQVLSTLVVTIRGALPLGGTVRVLTQERPRTDGRRRSDTALGLSVVAEGYGMVPVPTTVCEEVTARCGGTFKALVEPAQSTTTLTALLPIDTSAGESVSNIA